MLTQNRTSKNLIFFENSYRQDKVVYDLAAQSPNKKKLSRTIITKIKKKALINRKKFTIQLKILIVYSAQLIRISRAFNYHVLGLKKQ